MKDEVKPIAFKQANDTLLGGLIEDCEDLPVFKDGHLVISCWRVPVWKRLVLLFTGRVWLVVRGKTHPPLFIEAVNPFVRELR